MRFFFVKNEQSEIPNLNEYRKYFHFSERIYHGNSFKRKITKKLEIQNKNNRDIIDIIASFLSCMYKNNGEIFFEKTMYCNRDIMHHLKYDSYDFNDLSCHTKNAYCNIIIILGCQNAEMIRYRAKAGVDTFLELFDIKKKDRVKVIFSGASPKGVKGLTTGREAIELMYSFKTELTKRKTWNSDIINHIVKCFPETQSNNTEENIKNTIQILEEEFGNIDNNTDGVNIIFVSSNPHLIRLSKIIDKEFNSNTKFKQDVNINKTFLIGADDFDDFSNLLYNDSYSKLLAFETLNYLHEEFDLLNN